MFTTIRVLALEAQVMKVAQNRPKYVALPRHQWTEAL